MTSGTSPVSFRASVLRLPQKGMPVTIEADEAQRHLLAQTHGLLSLDSFRADLVVSNWKSDGVRVSGQVVADITQACVISLEPVESHVEAQVSALFVPENSRLAQIHTGHREEIVLDADGRPRFDRVSFAAHFDSLMRGRRGAVRPHRENELNPFREKFVRMFVDLQRDHGVRSYLAHNMTVTPSNIDQVSEVTRDVLGMPFDMLSFQPAAFIGDDRRWKEDFNGVTIDAVWERIEAGAGQRLPWQAVQFGDPRCNRTTVGLMADGRFAPVLDPDEPKDLTARDRFLDHFGGMIFGGSRKSVVTAKVLRALLRHPQDVPVLIGLAGRITRRAGGLRRLIRSARQGRIGFKTFVVHNFMDASVVAPAWELMKQGVVSEDPKLAETQQRLGSCMYAMSHPETGDLVPACVQHSILDPKENLVLRRLLPLTPSSTATSERPTGLTPVLRTGRLVGSGARR